jgi:hypothetical protein
MPFAAAPHGVTDRQQRLDGLLAYSLPAIMIAVSLLCWVPIPVAGLWLGSQADFLSGNVEFAIVVSFATAVLSLFASLRLLRRFDHA